MSPEGTTRISSTELLPDVRTELFEPLPPFLSQQNSLKYFYWEAASNVTRTKFVHSCYEAVGLLFGAIKKPL